MISRLLLALASTALFIACNGGTSPSVSEPGKNSGDQRNEAPAPGNHSETSKPDNSNPQPTVPPQETSPTVPASPVSSNRHSFGNLTLPGNWNLAGFRVNGQSVTAYVMNYMYQDISKMEFQLSGPDKVDSPISEKKLRNENYQPAHFVHARSILNDGVLFNSNNGFVHFNVITEIYTDVLNYKNVSGLPYLDQQTNTLWQFNVNGTVKMGKTTLKMPPLKQIDLQIDMDQFNQLDTITFDPKAHVLLWHGYDCSGLSHCLNDFPPSKALIWDIDKKKTFGPITLHGEGDGLENRLGWLADVLPNQREFALFGVEEKCLKLRMLSYSGVDRALPNVNAVLGAVCNVSDHFTGYWKISLRRLGDKGRLLVAFRDKILVIDTKADSIVETLDINKKLGEGSGYLRSDIIFAENDPNVFGVSIYKALAPGYEEVPQLQLFRIAN